jgi:hypothetical protein
MKLAEAISQACEFIVIPRITLFHVSASGEYDLLHTVKIVGACGADVPESLDEIVQFVERFKSEAAKPETVGLEVRVDGSRVQFDGV